MLTKSYEKVSPATAKKLEAQLPLVAGVQNVTYYPDTSQLQVYFRPTATERDLQAVKDLVRQNSSAHKG